MRRAFDRAAILLFTAALLAPTIDDLVRPDVVAHDVGQEMRAAAPAPVIAPTLEALNAFPQSAEDWYADRVGLRDVLLRARSHVYVRLLRTSPSPAVLLGKEGWVFPTLMGIVGASHGINHLGTGRLERWRRALESRKAFCASLGAEYVVAFAPEKGTVYPDFMPAGYALHPPSAYEQLRAWLDARSTLRLVDLQPVERAERANDRDGDFAYYPLGTHWTDRGMLAAYLAIHARLAERFPDLARREPAELEWFDDPNEGDTWASNMRLEGVLRQRARVLRMVESQYDGAVERPNGDDFTIRVHGKNASAPKLVFVHDSFGDRMRKLLARDFSDCTFAWQTSFDPEIVRRERPDVVIELHAERQVLLDRPAPIPMEGANPLAEDFDAMTDVRFVLAPARVAQDLTAVGGGVLEGALPELRFTAESGSELLELRDFEIPPGHRCIVRVEATSDHADVLDVLFRTRRMPRYRRGQVATATVQTGRNVLYADIDETDTMGPLRVRIGRKAGTYVLHSLEVRSAEL